MVDWFSYIIKYQWLVEHQFHENSDSIAWSWLVIGSRWNHEFRGDPRGMVALMWCWHWEFGCWLSCRWSTWWSRWWWPFPRELHVMYVMFMAPLGIHVMKSGKQLLRLGICRCPERISLQNTMVIWCQPSTTWCCVFSSCRQAQVSQTHCMSRSSSFRFSNSDKFIFNVEHKQSVQEQWIQRAFQSKFESARSPFLFALKIFVCTVPTGTVLIAIEIKFIIPKYDNLSCSVPVGFYKLVW